MPAEQGVDLLGIALERNPDPLDAFLLCDPLHGEFGRGESACRAIIDLARIGLRAGQKFRERFPGRILAHHHAPGVTGNPDDVGEIHRWIERRLVEERCPPYGVEYLRNGVAVGFCARRHLGWPNSARGARPVFDNDRLAEVLFGRRRERAKRHVGRPAGRVGHDEGDGSARKRLRQRAGAGIQYHACRKG